MSVLIIVGLSALLSQSITWTTKKALPQVRSGPGCAVINDTVYVIGGQSGSGNETTNYVYDPLSDNWSTKSPMPTARRHLGCAVVNGKIYAIGGFIAGETNIVEEYDPVADSWQTKTPMPTARYAFAIAVVANKIYVIGGYLTVKDRVEEYNPAADTAGGTPWQTKADMPTKRMGPGCAVIRDTIYVFGGYPSTKVNECYDPATNNWATKEPLSFYRYTGGSFSYDNKAYSVGGMEGWPVAHYSTAVEVYDPLSKGWSLETPMTNARQSVAVGLVGNKVYVIGGWNNAALAYNEEGSFPATSMEEISFDTFVHDYRVMVRWTASYSDAIFQYIIKRSDSKNGEYTEIAWIPGSGYTPSPQTYSHWDEAVVPGERYYYKLGVVKEDGNATWYGPISAYVTVAKPLLTIFPNPFNAQVKISLVGEPELRGTGEPEIKIYDLTGRLVQTLSLPTAYSLLPTEVTWDAKGIAPGVYYVTLKANDFLIKKKVIVLR
jgi:N-acetylneuraminic acid mutarotase